MIKQLDLGTCIVPCYTNNLFKVGKFIKIDHILSLKASFNKFHSIELNENTFSDHIKLN